MIYQGRELCLTFLIDPLGPVKNGYRPRYGFPTCPKGFTFDFCHAEKLNALIESGCEVIGTYPVGKHPADLWERARAGFVNEAWTRLV